MIDTRKLFQHFHWEKWFPQIPLALGLGLLGALQIVPFLNRVLGPSFLSGEIELLAKNLAENSLHGIHQGFLGVLLVVVSFGLLTRSRLSWVITLLITSTMFLLELLPQTKSHDHLFTAYVGILIILLILAYRRFNRTSLAIASLVAIVTGLMLLIYAVVGSYILGPQFQPPIQTFQTALYFSVTTISTVGFGDIIPMTDKARLFVISIIVLGLSLFATTISTILVPLMNQRIHSLLRGGERSMPRENHYIIIGDSPLARNSLKQLRLRNLPVTWVLPRSLDETLHDDIIVGDATDVDVLMQANADKAEALLALGEDDSDNAFVIMAANELGTNLRTVAAVNDSKNLKRVSRAKPDLIIAPEVLGAELLAMALGGETVNPEKLLERLLHFRPSKRPA